jgi:hypothetical protein
MGEIMKIIEHSIKVSGSQLISCYTFVNRYTAEQWQPANPYSGSCLLVYTPTGFFASDNVKAKALNAINQYHL